MDHLVNHLLAQETAEEMEQALGELLTASELLEMTKRLKILALLEEGVPQRQIAEQLGVGIATVTRGASVLKRRKGKD
jgi:TrpR family transcriptional regulator, trp operon repressor